MHPLLSGLNEAQSAAVTTTSGPLLIVAGAGAGKTKTLTHRIAYLIEKGAKPGSILAITFTNKAAREMRERALRLIGREDALSWSSWRADVSSIPWIGTFHALGIAILRESGSVIGVPPTFTVLDRDDSLSLIKRAMKDVGLDQKEVPASKVQSLVSKWKSELSSNPSFEGVTQNRTLASLLGRIARRYEEFCRTEKALDFDDLLVRTAQLLSAHPDILEKYRARWQFIHVDEYQDTNAVQYKIVRLLSDGHKNICVVGDSDQNIYSWRGASIANILSFEEDYPGAKTVLLEDNYRSTGVILDAANAIIEKNTMRKKKILRATGDRGEKIVVRQSASERDEATWAATTAAELLARGARPSDIAVLYRTNFQSRALEEAFFGAGIPYHVLGIRFFDRKEVKDLLSYLRAATNRESTIDIGRSINTPARGIGDVTLAKVLGGKIGELPATTRTKVDGYFAILDAIKEDAETKKASEIVASAIDRSGIGKALSGRDEDDQERLGNVRELVSYATRYDDLPLGEGITALLADIALASDQDNMEEKKDAVRLMTVHASKGLEFPYVFITGMEQDLFPSNRMDEERDLSRQEEERRLFYVALTRAARRVFLSYAAYRTVFGSVRSGAPSEFLADLPDELVDHEASALLDHTGFGGARDPWDAEPSVGWGAQRSGSSFARRTIPSRAFRETPVHPVAPGVAFPKPMKVPKPGRKVSLLDPMDGSDEDIIYF